uniref:HTH CENPB-type domain-containing protein n=1 Tax=Hemiselmis andersenii TaxID=464988 RepID=A0A6T8LWT0_HEMAN|mmetsp:Transcript_33464/g.78447  ORF Transcript_33464/g.78447 Transcript_33464/m.78447 type:complete len:361 (+) Transcript_33464:63-1145(+)
MQVPQQVTVDGLVVPGGVMAHGMLQPDSVYDDKKPSGGVQTEGHAKRRRVWSEMERQSHKQACTGKTKLTYGQKMDIIRRHEATDPDEHRSQAQLAEMFGKSRSAISKILRPEAMDRIKATAAAGIDQAVKRYFPPEHPELEKKLFQRIESMRPDASSSKGISIASATLCASAELIAKEMGIENFKPTAGWYSRFVKRYGLAKPPMDDQQVGMSVQQVQQMGMNPMGPGMGGGHVQQAQQVVHAPLVQIQSRMSKMGVIIKVAFQSPDGIQREQRRLEMQYDLDEMHTPINGFEQTMMFLRNMFQEDLAGHEPRVSYKDVEGDDTTILSDKELSHALHIFQGFAGGVVKFTVTAAGPGGI